MARGFISGLFWGALVSSFVVAVVSLATQPDIGPAEVPSSVDVAVPAGSEFNRNRPEAPPVIPQAEVPVAPADAPVVAAPDAETAPSADTQPAAAPVSAVDAPTTPVAPSADGAALPSAGQGDDGASSVSASAPAFVLPGAQSEMQKLKLALAAFDAELATA